MENTGPLKGLKVVEMGQLIAGPFCGQLLGDMGADVVKIEPPGKGDPMRDWGRGDYPLWWEVVARNKRSVSANLRVPEGQDLARRLIAEADVLIENFRPGTLEGWGLGPDRLHQDNPGLIVVRVSGYGQTGPYAQRAGFGGIGEAMGGWRYIVGDADRAPARMGVSIGDALAATYGCMGALAALRHRERHGPGPGGGQLALRERAAGDGEPDPRLPAHGLHPRTLRLGLAGHRALQRLSLPRRGVSDRRQPGHRVRPALQGHGPARAGEPIPAMPTTSSAAGARPSSTP